MLPDTTMAIDLSHVEDWEKLHILQVLRRNERIKQREDRRIQQLAVRIQLERMNDKRSPQLESQIKTITGHWHKDLAQRRSSEVDLTATLYRKISSDLTSSTSRKSSGSSPSSSKANDEVFDRAHEHSAAVAATNFGPEKLVAVRQWVNSQQLYVDGQSEHSGSQGSSFDRVNNNEAKKR